MVFAERDWTLTSVTAAWGTGTTAPEEGQAEKTYVWSIAVDGIATFRVLSTAIFTLDLARAATADLIALVDGGQMPPVLVDIRRSASLARRSKPRFGRSIEYKRR